MSRHPAGFGPVERAEFTHSVRYDVDSLVGTVSTRSCYLTAPHQRQRALAAAVRDLVASHPDLTGRDSFELPYRTFCYRARRQ